MDNRFVFITANKQIFVCSNEYVEDDVSLLNIGTLFTDLDLKVRLVDETKPFRCLFKAADQEYADEFVRQFLENVDDYKQLEFPFSYQSIVLLSSAQEQSIEQISERLLKVEQENVYLKKKIDKLEKRSCDLKPKLDPIIFHNFEVIELEKINSNGNEIAVYFATKKINLSNSIRLKRRRLCRSVRCDEEVIKTIEFEIPKQMIATSIFFGDIDEAVRKCRQHLYSTDGYAMLTYQTAPKNKDDLKYFALDEITADLYAKKFEFIIEICVQLINKSILDDLTYLDQRRSKLIESDTYFTVRDRLMVNCKAYRAKLRETCIRIHKLKAMKRKAIDEREENTLSQGDDQSETPVFSSYDSNDKIFRFDCSTDFEA